MTETAAPDDLVWICSHVEQMTETTGYVSLPRTEWEAMTSEQQDAYLAAAAMEAMTNAGGCGASVVDADEVPEFWKD